MTMTLRSAVYKNNPTTTLEDPPLPITMLTNSTMVTNNTVDHMSKHPFCKHKKKAKKQGFTLLLIRAQSSCVLPPSWTPTWANQCLWGKLQGFWMKTCGRWPCPMKSWMFSIAMCGRKYQCPRYKTRDANWCLPRWYLIQTQTEWYWVDTLRNHLRHIKGTILLQHPPMDPTALMCEWPV